MGTNYDSGHVADHYQQAKQHPWRSLVEEYSLLSLVGDISGKKVVDIACGEGYFTRRLRRADAATVVGIDISERMIDMARAQEESDPLGIDYRVCDTRTIGPQRDFDVAVSAWLLSYADSRAELARMCRGIASWLRPGGRFVTLTSNPEVYFFRPPPDYRKYGLRMTLMDHVYEGAPIRWTIDLGDTELEIENYYLPLDAFEPTFHDAGFRDFRIHPLQLDPGSQTVENKRYWREFMDNPIALLIDCMKA
ncbi:class I SAM-dependent methyltransferase [Nocardia sp. CNY236]|uniref:class I SAM-dependent methyltransferase n=1 Tax=Nocardia sp. CNY236 TaxID=1169152 RepID=UPI0004900E20|nr:class I SAM-dependent methyltransferase [Nocardia sp. CNY236]